MAPTEGGAAADLPIDARTELAALVAQARGLAELDDMLGVPCTPVPSLTPLRRPAAAPRPASSPAAKAADAPPAPAGPPADEALPGRRARNEQRLHELARRVDGCARCRLAEGRTTLVFGQGDAAAEVAFIGEGPGRHEDEQGLAFVGRAGELLTKMIQAMGLDRDEVFIGNVVKCRPPGNRKPQPDEMATCLPILEEQLDIVRPRVICALGKTAAVGLGLIRPEDPLGRNRGRFHEWRGIPVMVTYHPAYLLRNPSDKRKTWHDLQRMFPLIERRRAP